MVTEIDAGTLDFRALNEKLRQAGDACELKNCLGQRFIAGGMGGKTIDIYGIPGNALGAYLSGATIAVHGNAQDAVGDTMNDGTIVIHGRVGDAVGYAMRGGAIYVRGDAGYRAGIHMKEYREKKPILVIGGRAGSFLGEYQAGGLILVLGLTGEEKPIVGDFPCTGMHGGQMILRGDASGIRFPFQTTQHTATDEEKEAFRPQIMRFCRYFEEDEALLMRDTYTVVTPDSNNPYKQMYVAN